jgi:hypothetical protein
MAQYLCGMGAPSAACMRLSSFDLRPDTPRAESHLPSNSRLSGRLSGNNLHW